MYTISVSAVVSRTMAGLMIVERCQYVNDSEVVCSWLAAAGLTNDGGESTNGQVGRFAPGVSHRDAAWPAR